MNYLSEILTVASIHLLAVMNPGPDFIMVTKNALGHSRRSGMYTAFGLSAGLLTHITYCLAGIGLIISQSILLFNTIKLVGAAYLIYIGLKAISANKPSGDLAFKQRSNLSAANHSAVATLRMLQTPRQLYLY